MKALLPCGVLALFLAITPAPAPAGQPGDLSLDPDILSEVPSPPAKSHKPFEKDSWAVQVAASYIDSNAISDDEAEGATFNVGLGYYIFDGFGVFAELAAWRVEEDLFRSADAVGAGFNLLLRWHILRFDRWSIFIDGGAGIVQFDEDFPSNGTEFNFVERVGLGASIQLQQNLHLAGGARYLHLSNANIRGRDENPGVDALEYWAGLVLTF